MNDLKLDDGLKDIFCGEKKPLHPDTVHVTLTGNGKTREKAEPKDGPKDAYWEPIERDGWQENLKVSAKWVLCFGGLSLLFFYWQQTGQMATSASMPSICVCLSLAGFRVGKAFGGR